MQSPLKSLLPISLRSAVSIAFFFFKKLSGFKYCEDVSFPKHLSKFHATIAGFPHFGFWKWNWEACENILKDALNI